MLEYLRRASDRPLAKVLMGVLIFSFVGWGVASWIFGETTIDDSILRVGGRPLKVAAFEQERAMQMAAVPRAQQKQIYSDRATATAFVQGVMSKLTSDIMLGARAADLGLQVSTGAVADEIHRTEVFQENGRFSLEKFDALLMANGMTEQYYADAVRQQLQREMVLSGVLSPVVTSEFVVRAAYNARNATRRIEFVAVKYSDFKVTGSPTDEELAQIYAQNPKMIPEFREISYVLVPVSEMSEPDQYDAGYSRAQKLEDAIVAGESMAAIAKKINAKHVNIGEVSADKRTASGVVVSDVMLTDPMLARIFGMEAGIESEIIETKSGFMIVRVEKIVPTRVAPMDSMRTELAGVWRAEAQKKQAYLRANELLIALNDGDALPGAMARDVTRMDGAPSDVLVAAFANNIGTKTIVPGRDAFYVLAIREENAPKVDAAKIAALRQESSIMLSRALLDDYTAFLARKYPVKVNARMYKRIMGE